MRMGKRLCVCGHKTWEHDVPEINTRKCLLCSCNNFKYAPRQGVFIASSESALADEHGEDDETLLRRKRD